MRLVVAIICVVAVNLGSGIAATSELQRSFEAYRAISSVDGTTVTYEFPFDKESEKSLRMFASTNRTAIGAAFLLEYAEAAYRQGREVAPDIFDAALSAATALPGDTVFSRTWFSAAAALVEARGAGLDLGSARATKSSAYDLHVFPGDKRSPESTLDRFAARLDPSEVAIVRAVLRQQIPLNGLLVIRTFRETFGVQQDTLDGRTSHFDVSPNRSRAMNMKEETRLLADALKALSAAEAYPKVREEARLRKAATIAFIGEQEAALGDGPHVEALGLLAEAKRATNDPTLSFLASLFLGHFLQSRGQLLAAEGAYEDALQVFPEAWSGQVALQSVRYLLGASPSAADLRRLVGSPRTIASDPWLGYRYGRYAHWDDLVRFMRTATKVSR